ncbi:MAG: bifunctional 5,10-methylenetetrahydrofolate dehydrogenase/5,10-methenyltetrahydrofolate cyclohydrolase [Candidatus Margulisbacteria bacterium]|jgi:methylenetetrahydrofolate dehydrogenase (NADP+)/methenyltetrahydrofolate cyclohydrolase|nr:bifunctional 5,10-methylenetetrahydrofolate dehydrogenase/5,10-methenyltetrahydrofolate cyclohydrolase [Candidatus Margulisiibacteriota bacterium]
MTAQIIDGKKLAQSIKDRLKSEIAGLAPKPGLAVVLVGDDPASRTYVNAKEKDSREIGFYSEVRRLPKNTSEENLLELITGLNQNPQIHGLLVQLPLPGHIDESKIILAVDPAKDVDCFHPVNTGALFSGLPRAVLPCTPAGCLELIKTTGVSLSGKKAVVVGRSNIVGKPAALLLLQNNCTVTICHSRTADLAAEIRQADIVIAAAGKAGLITGAMLKKGAVVIDVGTNRVDGKLTGDIDFASAQEIAGFITPVPGGVGPLTRAMLMQNTLNAYKAQLQK